jgi:hypothetical protein
MKIFSFPVPSTVIGATVAACTRGGLELHHKRWDGAASKRIASLDLQGSEDLGFGHAAKTEEIERSDRRLDAAAGKHLVQTGQNSLPSRLDAPPVLFPLGAHRFGERRLATGGVAPSCRVKRQAAAIGRRLVFYDALHLTRADRPVGLDNAVLRRTGDRTVNPNTHQKLNFCARQHPAVGVALYICPERPGAAS